MFAKRGQFQDGGLYKAIFFCFQLWANYEEPKNIVVVEETERKCNYKKVC